MRANDRPRLSPLERLVAAFPQHHRAQIGIEVQERQERWAAGKIEIAASRPTGFQPRLEIVPPTRAAQILGEATTFAFVGRSIKRHPFLRVSGTDRAALAAGHVVLLAARFQPGRVDTLAIEAFEAESGARLTVWLDRAGAAVDIRLYACFLGCSRLERAAIVADLTDRPARRSGFVVDGRFDRRAIMAAAIAQAKAARGATSQPWGLAISAALLDVWQAAKAARLTTSH